jgi:uncharacterized Tic20 family protein
MESSINKHQRNLAAAMHISTFSKYIFPFGNFIFPLILWTSNKNESDFVDHNGKQAINFQISILLYSMIIGAIAFIFTLFTAWDIVEFINLFEHNKYHIDLDFNFDNPLGFGASIILMSVAGIFGLGLLVLDIFCSITATIKANEGVEYQYPFTINFIK